MDMSLEQLKQAECGDCGNNLYTIYKTRTGTLITVCTKCKTKSVISISTPKLEINFHEDSTGRMHFNDGEA